MVKTRQAQRDIGTRREFGERMKECCNNDEFQARKMHKTECSFDFPAHEYLDQ